MHYRFAWLAVAGGLIAARVFAQQTPPGPDFGMVCATALEVAPGQLKDTTKIADTKNYVFRGRVITLDREKSVHLVFDTEMLRVAGVWAGKPIHSMSQKTMGPAIDGTMLFATKPGPGWSVNGKWTDPRPVPEGPLPRSFGHYKGMFLHGDRVVLSYAVAGGDVLESPSLVGSGDDPIVQRSFTFAPTTQPRKMLVSDAPGGLVGAFKNREKGPHETHFADVRTPSGNWIIGVRSAPHGATLEADGDRVFVNLPASDVPMHVSLITTKSPGIPLRNALESEPVDLTPLTKGGPPRWTQVLETKGTPSADAKSPYVVDTIQLPETNPWRGSIRFGGLDFFDDGRAALCTWDGDVWIVSGLDESLMKITWKRFAAGLHQPLGLKIVKGVIHVAGRDQITKLHDLNCDGEADYYENFNNDAALTLQRHEFVMGLETDAEGNFYYCHSGHYVLSKKGENCCVMKVSPDGKKLEVFARGFREPNGMSIGPDGTMTVADNEGNSIPQTPLYRLQQGRDYGFTPPASFQIKETPIIWLPPTVDRSAGGQVWAPKNWGPLGGQLLHTSYGNAALFAVLVDKKADPWQGAVWRFPMNFTSGIMRARFSPVDWQLYVCGLRGWDTNGTRDGDFSRVRFTGAKTPVPIGIEVTKNSIIVEFSGKLDIKSAQDDQNWACEWSTGPVTKKAASKEMPIERIRLAADERTVTIDLEEGEKMRPAPNYSLRYRIRASDGSLVTGTLHGTIHGGR